ncbi:retrovirus-related pol polyprotein from transposon TNT 1-94 [Tanacetum coccineum]|uniref:Retrovirus-related pol polyprotein from transposon TNT 1-94 n=1 Tax=Tanacetum coccineum TaxID=301880 RepID=A0ABQ5GKY1_9ASTR
MANLSKTSIFRFRYPPPILIGLTLHHGNKEFDCNFQVKRLGETLEVIDTDHFRWELFGKHLLKHKGETIHDYYVWFSKLINDMRNIKITMSRMQLNSMFVNNMLPEWGRFVTAVKLNRGLRDSNYDQLLDVIMYQTQQYNLQSSTNLPSTYVPPHFANNTQLDSGLSPLDNLIENLTNTLALLTQSYKMYLPQTNNQLKTSSNPQFKTAKVIVSKMFRVDRIEDRGTMHGVQVKCYNCNSIGHIARNCTHPKRPQNSEYFKDKMLLMQAQENWVALNEEKLLFIAADDYDDFDFDVDEAPTTQTMFMANLSSADPVFDEAGPSYDSDILSEVHDHDHYQDAVCEHHEEHEMRDDVQPTYVVDSHANYTSDSNIILYDHLKRKNLSKRQTTASRPIKALTVYPPNTPATLVPRVLPTKSQVKINIFALIQLFLEFEKTCKKRITPTGLTEGERGFEQTKECYLTEVIPFFKTLKEHFEGIQKALTKEIKEMKDIFEELEAEVDQNVVNRKHDEIERKNLLIANDNLIADCLSKEVFYIATNSELTVSRFTEMHEAHTIVQTRCLELEAELSKLRDKVQKDDHTELVKRFSNLEVNHLNLQLKYQNLKESFGNDPSPPARDTPDFDSVFTRSEADRTLDFRTLDFQITQLTKKVSVLQEQNELFRAENEKVKQHYKELYDSIKITRAKHIEQTTALLTENENLKAQIHENLKCNTIESVKPRVLAPGRYAIDVEPIPPHNRNNREVHLHYLKHLKESVETLREIVEEAKVERSLDRSLASACLYTKHSQELLEYVIGTFPKDFNQRDKKHAPTPLIRKKQVTFDEQCDKSNSNTYKHVEQLNTQKTNVPVAPSTGVNCCTNASGSQPRSNTKKNRISPALKRKRVTKKK